MFQSVLDQRGLQSGRFGTGAGVSVLVHAGVVAAALLLSAGAADTIKKDPVDVVFKLPPRPPKGNPNPPAATPPPAQKPPPPKKRREFVAPAVVPTLPLPVDPAPVAPDPVDPDLPHVPGGHIDGDPVNGDPNAPPPVFTPELPINQMGEEAVPYDSRMSMPKLISGDPIQYTREAREARVRGTLVAKCVITRQGDVENCRLIKGVPYMDQAVISALETRRYRPVMFQGEPISVTYIFNVRLEMPH
jgi:periplasmic protein TonB